MVLIPKTPGATKVDTFRPICLQNSSVKILAKTLTTRLQKEIGDLIDLNQTGFLKGRSIADTFVYAAEVVQACHKRKLSALVIKLDFAKAFDTVSWVGLDCILQARGFSNVWRDWIQSLLSSSKSAVLVNGCPGPWITCRRGLPQGGPMSPYLFLIVADTLQAMIRDSADEIKHPIDQSASCAMFQYADDTLIVLKGDLRAVQKLKIILDLFAAATGLTINYNKSSAVPIHMNDGLIQQCIDTLGCKRESFPQNYLGMPLSAHKLPNLVFSTYIERIEKSLSSWQASLLNTMGRVVLINSVLDSKLIYVMSSMQLPPGLLQQVDKLRRAFLWAGDQNTSSSKCLVALQNVCTTKELGGLGIKDLGTHNICLLLKLIHRLHCANYSAWATWIRQRANLASLKGDLRGHHWEMLRTTLSGHHNCIVRKWKINFFLE